MSKPRLLVLTDIGGDPDDQQSLVRLLVHSDLFDLEGLIPEHWAPQEHKITPEQQMELVYGYYDAYEKVLPNLRKHSEEYPSASHLRSITKRGAAYVPFILDASKQDLNPFSIIGEGRDTEGSEWIIRVVDKEDERPLNICVWGGTADLAQALWKVQNTRSKKELQVFLAKIRVHAISDQDQTSAWIRSQFPELFYIFNHARTGDKWQSCYRGMFLGGDVNLNSAQWVFENIKENHGELGAMYPHETYTGSNSDLSIKEGDTPSWLYFICNGLNVPKHPSYGGWGGRYEKNGTFYQDAEDCFNGETGGRVTVWRWRPAFQNNFAARMDRCVKDFNEVNHEPVVVLNGNATNEILTINARPNALIELNADGSYDPDGDELTYRWWIYKEAGTYEGEVSLKAVDDRVAFNAPADGTGKELHVILEVTDNGEPCLTSYRRVIISLN